MRNRAKKKLCRFNYSDRGRRLIGACSNMNMPLTDWVGKGDQAVLNFKLNNIVSNDFFAFVLVGYITQEWFFVIWQVDGRRFWFGARALGVYQDVDFGNVTDELKKSIQIWDFEDDSVFYFDGKFI